jgi:ubiquinone/menaquinone biosynthesis C-methylase UbiE
MAETDGEFPLVHASAEATLFDDASFDIVCVPP